MQLIYLAPLAWSSFAQRPHMFVRWFHEKYQCSVLWVNPYPTRFPSLNDFKRITNKPDTCATEIPEWLDVISPKSLPVEPLSGSQFIHAPLWRPLLQKLREFSSRDETLLAIGKPSALAIKCLESLPNCKSFYDAMDDYPQFYKGLSRIAFVRREQLLVKKIDFMAVSSTNLMAKWSGSNKAIQLVRNALTPDLFLPIEVRQAKNSSFIFGYIGTIAQWFDWAWVVRLALIFPDALVRLIGPCFTQPPKNLPSNIQILPACDHASAITAMRKFDVGLIPFKLNELTASVDPIKFYEYRALGIPVVSTTFGEMVHHQSQSGTFLSRSASDIEEVMHIALNYKTPSEEQLSFVVVNSWEKRFEQLEI